MLGVNPLKQLLLLARSLSPVCGSVVDGGGASAHGSVGNLGAGRAHLDGAERPLLK
jgi:hypothetical protein